MYKLTISSLSAFIKPIKERIRGKDPFLLRGCLLAKIIVIEAIHKKCKGKNKESCS
jgi:hypothetical protein